MHYKANTALILLISSLASCKSRTFSGQKEGADIYAVSENDSYYAGSVSIAADALPPIHLDATLSPEFIDIRGVGDTAWAGIKVSQAPASELGSALKDLDPTGKVLKGDLSFMNYESTVSEGCSSWYGVDWAFLSHPSSVREAYEHGFNLFGLSNNHSEDCARADGGLPGGLATRNHMRTLNENRNFLWHGVGEGNDLSTLSIRTFDIKGRKVTVALASVVFESWDTENSARGESSLHGEAILSAFKEQKADLKILAVHTQGNFEGGRAYGDRFISEAGGDVVFAHGPHTWAGVKVIEKAGGGKGVAFNGLGNFIHTGCSDNPHNLLGRVILDTSTLKLRQIQVIPVLNHFGGSVSFRGQSNNLPLANVNWASVTHDIGGKIYGAYANIQ